MTFSTDKKSLLAFYQDPSRPVLADAKAYVDHADLFTLNSRCVSLALKKLTGKSPEELLCPQDKPEDLVALLESNSISYRYLSLLSLDINGYFGFIIVTNKSSGFPELLFYSATTSYRFLSDGLTTIPLTAKGLTDFEDSCVEIFSPLPDKASSSGIAGYAIKSTELQFFFILLF